MPLIDGIAERIRPGQRREPVLAAWGFTSAGAKVLLHLIRAAERWRAIKLTDFERRQMAALRNELDQEYEAQSGLAKQPSKGLHADKLSSSSRT